MPNPRAPGAAKIELAKDAGRSSGMNAWTSPRTHVQRRFAAESRGAGVWDQSSRVLASRAPDGPAQERRFYASVNGRSIWTVAGRGRSWAPEARSGSEGAPG